MKTTVLMAVIMLMICSCQKEINGDLVIDNGGNPSNPGTSPNADYYFKGKLDGVATTIIVDETKYYTTAGSNNFGEIGELLSGIIFEPLTNPKGLGILISKGNLDNFSSLTPERIKAFLVPGPCTYRPGSGSDPESLGNGISIQYLDSNGETWDTNYGTRNQSGSSFKIISATEIQTSLGRHYMKVKAQFNCNLYHETKGTVKKLTEGEYVGIFGPW